MSTSFKLIVAGLLVVSGLGSCGILGIGAFVAIVGAVGANTGAKLYQQMAYLDVASASVSAAAGLSPTWKSALAWAAQDNCSAYTNTTIQPALSDLLQSIWWTETNFDGSAPGQVGPRGTLLTKYREKSSAGAVGPMQFEPTTFAGYVARLSFALYELPSAAPSFAQLMSVPPQDRIYNLYWSFAAAAKMLCNDGLQAAANTWALASLAGNQAGENVMPEITNAVTSYNHSAGYALGVIAQAMIWAKNLPLAPPNFVATLNGMNNSQGGNQGWAALALAISDLTVIDTMLQQWGQVMKPVGGVPPTCAYPCTASGFASATDISLAYQTAVDSVGGKWPLVAQIPDATSLYDATRKCTTFGGGKASVLQDRHYPGDLVFFSATQTATASVANLDHVGVYLGIFNGGPNAGKIAVADIPGVGQPVNIETLASSPSAGLGQRLMLASFADGAANPPDTQYVQAVTNPAQMAAGAQLASVGC
ncbi:MAG: hypothetical protein M1522_08805 [Actinobacteria bacterium]|jgi:hypothetical protein|nr:hypothetical protein [Actinomycetota bacterium]